MADGKVTCMAAIYPFKLCKALLTGTRGQLRDDARLTLGICGIQRTRDAGMSTQQLEQMVQRHMAKQNVRIEGAPRPDPRACFSLGESLLVGGEPLDLIESEHVDAFVGQVYMQSPRANSPETVHTQIGKGSGTVRTRILQYQGCLDATT